MLVLLRANQETLTAENAEEKPRSSPGNSNCTTTELTRVAAAPKASKGGMQKHELTMFRGTCYSSLVPRVHPGLLCAAKFSAAVCGGVAAKLLKGVSGLHYRDGNFPR